MKVMMIVKGNAQSEAGVMPSEELLATMGKFNEELVKAGVLLELSGLYPTSRGAKVKYRDGNRTVIDGPFSEAKEVIAGFWLIQVKSMAEAIEWAKRAPMDVGAQPGEEAEVEIRQLIEMEDFGDGPAATAARERYAEFDKSKK